MAERRFRNCSPQSETVGLNKKIKILLQCLPQEKITNAVNVSIL